MPFKKLLGELVSRVPGALGAVLADWEGEAVDQSGHLDEYELKILGAHKGVILQNLREVVARRDNDQVRELVVTTEKIQTIVMPVTPDYFLVLAHRRENPLGRALFEGRRTVALLREEIG